MTRNTSEMPPRILEVRCKHCGILLARVGKTGLTIRLDDLEAHFTGSVRASLRCHRRRCRSMNELCLSTEFGGSGAYAVGPHDHARASNKRDCR